MNEQLGPDIEGEGREPVKPSRKQAIQAIQFRDAAHIVKRRSKGKSRFFSDVLDTAAVAALYAAAAEDAPFLLQNFCDPIRATIDFGERGIGLLLVAVDRGNVD